MKKLLLSLIMMFGAFFIPHAAYAACGSVPYSPVNGISIVDANQYNRVIMHFYVDAPQT
jgi:hypothetical protein